MKHNSLVVYGVIENINTVYNPLPLIQTPKLPPNKLYATQTINTSLAMFVSILGKLDIIQIIV